MPCADLIAKIRDEKGADAVSGLLPITADVKNPSSLVTMCQMVQCLINCVGPFRYFGEPVVQAAIEGSCHYVDITGEPEFMENMYLKYNDAAAAKGLRIVNACGMDSIPADIMTRHAAREFEKRFSGSKATEVEQYWSVSGNGKGVAVHYGTWHSLVESMGNVGVLKRIRRELKAKHGDQKVQYLGARQQRHTGPHHEGGAISSWTLPFPGADAAVVRRTQQQLAASPAGEFESPVQYAVYFTVPEWYHVLLFMVFGSILSLLAGFQWGRQLLLDYPGLFSMGVFSHEGPSAEQMAATTFACTFKVSGYVQRSDAFAGTALRPDASLVFVMKGPEPGYVSTSAMVVAAARALVEHGGRQEDKAVCGVLTPGTAFNSPAVAGQMLERLRERGIVVFEVQT